MHSLANTESKKVVSARLDVVDKKQCIRLSFESGEDKAFSLASLQKNSFQQLAITRGYESLIGKTVSLSPPSDLPQNALNPSNTKSSFWINCVWVTNKNVDIETHIAVKGVCTVCGIGDGLLNYFDDEENRWFHYRCKIDIDIANQHDQQPDKTTLTSPNVLISVTPNVVFADGSINTVLVLGDGSQKIINTNVFDRDSSITKKALSLIGKEVSTTCWDPLNEPGKWSSLGYFNDISEID